MVTSDAVEDAIAHLGLDDRAAGLLRAMDSSDAADLLDSMGPDLKNPSAYITKAANDRAHGKGRGKGASSSRKEDSGRRVGSGTRSAPLRRVEDEIAALQLDDRASNVLMSMPSFQALELIDSIPGNVRNISAYITKAVNDRAHGKSPPASATSTYTAKAVNDGARHAAFAPQRMNHRRQLEQSLDSLCLDERAASTLRAMDPQQAVELLDSIPAGIRNPSAYITKAANDRLHQPQPGAFGMAQPVMFAAPPMHQFMHQPVYQILTPVPQARWPRDDMYPTAFSAFPVRRQREDAQKSEEVEAQIHALHLDEKASNLLRSLAPMDAIGLLESMDAGVRNPSAFITKGANDRLNGKVDVESHRWKQVDALAEELGLDDRARQVVTELPSMEAYRVLANCREKADSVKNPSAYVLKGVAAVQREMEPHSKRRRMA